MSQQRPQIKAWSFTTPGYPTCLHQSTLPSPTTSDLKPTYLLIQPRAAGINPVDIQLSNLPIFNLPIWPFNVEKVTGCDFAGTILAVGSSVQDFKKGDEVMGVSLWQGWNGTLAECIVIDTKSATIVKKPAAWSWEKAGGISLVWQTARTMIENASAAVQKSQEKKVAVLGGSSSTGMYIVHLAHERGWKVLSTCSGKNVEFVKSMGADVVVDYTSQSVREEVKAYKPDAIIDCVGGTECIDLAKRYITIVGDKTTRTTMGGAMIYLWNPQMLLRWALGRFGLSSVEYDCSNIQMVREWLEEATALPEDKVVVDSVFEFERAKEAFERLNTGRARGKVVVKIG